MSLEPLPTAALVPEGRSLAGFSRRFWLSLPWAIAGLALALSGGSLVPDSLAVWRPPLEVLLASPVVWWSGRPIFERAVASVLDRRASMWTLLGVGIAAAYGVSVLALWPALA